MVLANYHAMHTAYFRSNKKLGIHFAKHKKGEKKKEGTTQQATDNYQWHKKESRNNFSIN